jgi:hypothetical protein
MKPITSALPGGSRAEVPRTDEAVQAHDEDVRDLLALAEWDWVVGGTGRSKFLHHLASFDDPKQAGDDWGGPGVASCGYRNDWFCIPGIFTRMGAERCPRCCKAVGFPVGVGSPKNDEALRPLVEARIA